MENLSDDGIQNTPEPSGAQSLFSTLFISIFSCLFSIGCCYFALFSISFRHGLINSANKIVELQSECLKPIPSKYSLSISCLLPCKTSIPIPSAKWSNAVIFSLESQYRSQGITLQFLPSDEYTSFSEKHYARYASEVMGIDPITIDERIGQAYDFRNFIILGAPENIVYFNNFKFSFNNNLKILSNKSQTNSPKLQAKIKYIFNQTIMPEKASINEDITTNPLSYGLTSAKRITGIEAIKRALISGSHPILVSFKLPFHTFYKEVNEKTDSGKPTITIYDNIQNQKKSSQSNVDVSCPFNNSKKCHKFILYPPSSIIINPYSENYGYNERVNSYGNPVVMALVGYNDNFILHTNSSSFLKGGFIMRSVFMENEHSREYFMNEISSYQDMNLCYDYSNPKNWPVASSVQCMIETKNSTLCGSVEFECLNDLFCNNSLNYTYFGDNNFIEWGKNVEPRVIQIDFPYNYLSYVIKPKNISGKSQSSRNRFCGYSFIPYKVVENMYLYNQGPFSFDAADIQVKWSENSYYSQKTSSKKYSKLRDSTYKMVYLDKRLPYDEIEL